MKQLQVSASFPLSLVLSSLASAEDLRLVLLCCHHSHCQLLPWFLPVTENIQLSVVSEIMA